MTAPELKSVAAPRQGGRMPTLSDKAAQLRENAAHSPTVEGEGTGIVAQVVAYYQRSTGLGDAAFLAELNAPLASREQELSDAQLADWQRGTGEPSEELLIELIRGLNPANQDWRMEFALHLLAALDPARWEPFGGAMWKLYRAFYFYGKQFHYSIHDNWLRILEEGRDG